MDHLRFKEPVKRALLSFSSVKNSCSLLLIHLIIAIAHNKIAAVYHSRVEIVTLKITDSFLLTWLRRLHVLFILTAFRHDAGNAGLVVVLVCLVFHVSSNFCITSRSFVEREKGWGEGRKVSREG